MRRVAETGQGNKQPTAKSAPPPSTPHADAWAVRPEAALQVVTPDTA